MLMDGGESGGVLSHPLSTHSFLSHPLLTPPRRLSPSLDPLVPRSRSLWQGAHQGGRGEAGQCTLVHVLHLRHDARSHVDSEGDRDDLDEKTAGECVRVRSGRRSHQGVVALDGSVCVREGGLFWKWTACGCEEGVFALEAGVVALE